MSHPIEVAHIGNCIFLNARHTKSHHGMYTHTHVYIVHYYDSSSGECMLHWCGDGWHGMVSSVQMCIMTLYAYTVHTNVHVRYASQKSCLPFDLSIQTAFCQTQNGNRSHRLSVPFIVGRCRSDARAS